LTRERIVTGDNIPGEDESLIQNLRPQTLHEYIGQTAILNKLSISLDAAKKRGEPQEHILLYGPPGLGKTTLAHIISNEMKSRLISTSGPAITRIADLMGIITNIETSDILFIDEIHRLPKTVEEFIYPAMEDFKVDFIVDKGPFSKVINIPIKKFTLIGATTRVGLLTSPLRDRFGISYHLDFYPPEDIFTIVMRSAKILGIEIEEKGAELVSIRSRGTPRIANRLLRRSRDYAIVKGDGKITAGIAEKSLVMEGIDSRGLDDLDRKFLKVIMDYYGGGPVGIEAIAATLSEEVDTLEELVEPYLLKIGFLIRTRRGRMASDESYSHLGMERKTKVQWDLFNNGE
jgi:holliday junction DNA helicase RuvB